MHTKAPHFLLFSESRAQGNGRRGKTRAGQWRFVLEAVDGSTRFEAEDEEGETEENRLELLAVVRGLESLDRPARVTLVTPSRYVNRGFRYGLEQWRENNWQWESYGEMTPIRNRDLWQRIDRAMRFHQVDCRVWRFDPAEIPTCHPQTKADKGDGRVRSGRRKTTAPQSSIFGIALRAAGRLLDTCLGSSRRTRTRPGRLQTA